MAVHLKKILGDLLYLEEPDETKDHLPSPEDLRNKVSEHYQKQDEHHHEQVENYYKQREHYQEQDEHLSGTR
jgi:hypothetical protein